MSFHPLQADTFSLAGSGVSIGDTVMNLKSFTDINGSTIAMSDLGSIAYMTLEPGNGTQEEQISFTGVTQNADGSAQLTGIKTVLFKTPYTETSGFAKTHAGSVSAVLSNTAGFYHQFTAKDNDEVITGTWTFNNFPITPSNTVATPSVLGVSKLSTAAVSTASPIVVGDNDYRVPVAYATDSSGTDAYAVTPSPAITAYAAGQVVTFKAGTANTAAATLNVSGLGAKAIKKNVNIDLATGDILASQIITVVYDGTNFQLVSRTSTASTVQVFTATGANVYTKPSGLSYAIVELMGGGGQGACARGGALTVGGGGGAGAYARKVIAGTLLSGVEIATVGYAGAGANGGTNANGATGGNSTFTYTLGSGTVTAGGGAGGNAGSAAVTLGFSGTGGAGGTASGADFAAQGAKGGTAATLSSTVCHSGDGASGIWGCGGEGSTSTDGDGNNATGFGAGGSGATDTSNSGTSNGGKGSPGIIIVTEFY